MENVYYKKKIIKELQNHLQQNNPYLLILFFLKLFQVPSYIILTENSKTEKRSYEEKHCECQQPWDNQKICRLKTGHQYILQSGY